MNKQRGITLIALVVTIIILLILAMVTIATLTGENGILKKAMDAKEETQIKGYHEKIELIRNELRLEKENYSSPTIAEMKEEFDKHQTDWVAGTEIKQVDGIETVELKTKEGYIFHITETGTEYKGKGKVVDTSALKRENALKLEIIGEGTNGGKLVQITDMSGVDYYKIEYQINGTDGNWITVESGSKVDVPPSATIYARLTYGTSKGVIVSLSIEASAPTVVAKNTDSSQIVRKTQTPLVDLFKITWGSDGTGTVEYSVTGNLNFKNTTFNSTEISNLSELEVGNYTVTCKVTSPSKKQATATKQNVKVTKLAKTTVTNGSSNVTANAIYSEYDLAYFRDLVNKQNNIAINGKIMNQVDLSKVCGATIENWEPIGNNKYSGIFDGENNIVDNLYINTTDDNQGLFGNIENATIIGIVIGKNSTITGNARVGSIVGKATTSTIKKCGNNGIVIGKDCMVGGILGQNFKTEIGECYNKGETKGQYVIGGICGFIENSTSPVLVSYSYNVGNITGGYYIAGIVGAGNDYAKINNCYNNGTIIGNRY